MSTVEYKNKHAKLYGGLIPKGENENEKDWKAPVECNDGDESSCLLFNRERCIR